MIKSGLRCVEHIRSFAFRCACLLLITLATWGGLNVPSAQADFTGTGSEKAADIMKERAASELDRMAGAGTSARLEGSVQGSVGKVTDDAVDQVKGKAKRDIGRVKGAAADAGESLEEAADAVKDFLN